MKEALHAFDEQAKGFGTRMFSLCEARGMNLSILAEEIGGAQPTLSRIVSGDRIASLQVLLAVSSFFHVSTDFLLGNEEVAFRGIPEDIKRLLSLYDFASPEDKQIIQMILAKNDPAKHPITAPVTSEEDEESEDN